jgi:hypothetical protein
LCPCGRGHAAVAIQLPRDFKLEKTELKRGVKMPRASKRKRAATNNSVNVAAADKTTENQDDHNCDQDLVSQDCVTIWKICLLGDQKNLVDLKSASLLYRSGELQFKVPFASEPVALNGAFPTPK